jgi:hypothetical protein
MANLWELSNSPLCNYDKEFESWHQFIKSKLWIVYSSCKPVHWSWIKLTPEQIKEIEEEDSDEEYSVDTLTLVYLQIYELHALSVKVAVKEEEQNEIRKWLFENKFLAL